MRFPRIAVTNEIHELPFMVAPVGLFLFYWDCLMVHLQSREVIFLYDIAIQNGLIADGTGSAPYQAALYIKDGKIALITTHILEAARVIDAKGLVVSPGFIDIHTHSDPAPLLSELSESKLYQGVTTELGGNCGLSLIPATDKNRQEILQNCEKTLLDLSLGKLDFKADSISDYAEILSHKKMSLNIGTLIGHGSLRGCIMGFDDREPTPEELEQMKALLDSELKKGAFGLSLGLIYPPGSFSKTPELLELAKVVAANGALLTTHMRSESDEIFEAVDEMLEIAEKTGVRLQISHLKLIGKKQWHQAPLLLEKIANARKRGIAVTCDQYPYHASSTGLSAVLPHWAHSGGNEQMLRRLRHCEEYETLLPEIEAAVASRGGADRIGISSTSGNMPEIEGKTIAALAEEYALSPEQTIVKILIACNGGVNSIYYAMHQDDVLEIMKDMHICIGSDGSAMPYHRENSKVVPHPRSFGTFPRFLQTVREHQLMPIELAVYKMTGLTTEIMRLSDRGVLKEGNIADITIFDYEQVTDLSTFQNATVKPLGINYVLVGGQVALENGIQTTARMGQMLLQN